MDLAAPGRRQATEEAPGTSDLDAVLEDLAEIGDAKAATTDAAPDETEGS